MKSNLKRIHAIDASVEIFLDSWIRRQKNAQSIEMFGSCSRGKTSFLNGLSSTMQSGKSYATRGFSFAVPINEQAKGLIILDSQGVQKRAVEEILRRIEEGKAHITRANQSLYESCCFKEVDNNASSKVGRST